MLCERIFLSLGTNLGNKQENLRAAKAALSPDVVIRRESAIYVTSPWGYLDQPDFLNQVVEIETALEPFTLLRTLKNIESELGRVKTFRFGPRLIDLDILFYGQRIIQDDALQIPHPRIQERAFVLLPLCEIAPDFMHPLLKKSMKDLLSELDLTGVRLL